MSGIEDVGFAAALVEGGIFMHFDGYFGVSVGAISMLYADNPIRGFGIFKRLTGKLFIKLSRAQRLKQMQIVARAFVTLSAVDRVYRYTGIKTLASYTGLDKILTMTPLLDHPHLLRVIRNEFPPNILRDGKEKVVVTTNLQTGKAAYHDLQDAKDIDEALRLVEASSFLPYLSGQKPPVLTEKDGSRAEHGDGCFSDPYPIIEMVKRGYTHIVVPLSRHPDHILRADGELRQIVELYNYLNPRPNADAQTLRETVYADNERTMRDILEQMEKGEFEYNGQRVYVRLIAPDKEDPKTDPLTTNEQELEDAFMRGFARGRMFVHGIEREFKAKHAKVYESSVLAALGLGAKAKHPMVA